MDFRSIRVDDVSFEPIKNARNGLRYGGNTSLKFQVPRLRYRISANPHGSMTLTPTSVIFPNEFDAFVSSLVEKSGVTCTHPFERIATTNDTIMFDSHERVMDTDPRPDRLLMPVSWYPLKERGRTGSYRDYAWTSIKSRYIRCKNPIPHHVYTLTEHSSSSI